MHIYNILCKIEWTTNTYFNLIWKPTDLPWFDVTTLSSWLVKMCLIFTMGQNDLTNEYISEINEKSIWSLSKNCREFNISKSVL